MDDPTTAGVTEGFGLMFYNARWYDPALGRFAQADTIVPAGVQGLDRYAYVNNSPMNFTDPSGHFSCSSDPENDDYCPNHSPSLGGGTSGNGRGGENRGEYEENNGNTVEIARLGNLGNATVGQINNYNFGCFGDSHWICSLQYQFTINADTQTLLKTFMANKFMGQDSRIQEYYGFIRDALFGEVPIAGSIYGGIEGVTDIESAYARQEIFNQFANVIDSNLGAQLNDPMNIVVFSNLYDEPGMLSDNSMMLFSKNEYSTPLLIVDSADAQDIISWLILGGE